MASRGGDSPRALGDNGKVVEIDVHGCSVGGAIHLIKRTVLLAAARGRLSVEVIHGMGDREGSIRSELLAELERGQIPQATGFWEASGRTTISLPVTVASDGRRIRVLEVVGD